ncbi:hypothetical protein PVAP13_3NG213413 [Panicum virgatum]|uniref:Uncharacterized protein n=1 Tax=Panicum virgatum TaxID=38727 RepID=A0A8T0UI79_PANVG|nr:hypothetical protein PVAP13_3NG213413 [Panicum virgatum]
MPWCHHSSSPPSPRLSVGRTALPTSPRSSSPHLRPAWLRRPQAPFPSPAAAGSPSRPPPVSASRSKPRSYCFDDEASTSPRLLPLRRHELVHRGTVAQRSPSSPGCSLLPSPMTPHRPLLSSLPLPCRVTRGATAAPGDVDTSRI